LSCKTELRLFKKLKDIKSSINNYVRKNTFHKIYYRTTGGRHYKAFTDFQPEFYFDGERIASSRETFVCFENKEIQDTILSLLNSNLYIWFYYMNSNCRDNNPSDISRFPFYYQKGSDTLRQVKSLAEKLMLNLKENSTLKNSNNGRGRTQTFSYSYSKPIIDQIDSLLAQHYGFTEEELDFIINYDIKYRMGKELFNSDNEKK